MARPPRRIRRPSLVGLRVDDRFEILSELERGGSGVVFRGRDMTDDSPVAIKVLRPEVEDDETRTRFLREARVQVGLSSPHLAKGIAIGTLTDGSPALVTELVQGESLYDAIYEHRRMTPRRALIIARQILLGLEHAHAQGIIHRDLKPENVLLAEAPAGTPRHIHAKIIDFGLVATVASADAGFRFTRITMSGMSLGTPAYMAPEQAEGGDPDARTDIYAVGTMLFEMILGRLPFESPSPVQLLQLKLSGPAPTLADVAPGPWCTPELEGLVATALAADPAHRFDSARAMLDALEPARASLESLPPDPAW